MTLVWIWSWDCITVVLSNIHRRKWVMDSHETHDACENRWLRRILQITYKDRITNETARQRTQQVPMSNSIRQMWLKWLGYVLRMDNRLTKSVHQWKPTRKRSRGRPNKRWMDCIEEDLWRAGVTRCGKTAGRQRMTLNDIAADRQQWKKLTVASTAEIN